MSARLQSLSPRALYAVAGVVVLLYAAAVWFLFVSPKRSEASEAKADVAAAELRLVQAQASRSRPRGADATVADVFRLAKAMPSSAEQSSLVLEISRLAQQSGVKLTSIAPKAPVAGVGGPSLIPVTVIVRGSYAQITRFLARTRALVTVRRGTIHARGRLLAAQTISLVESATEGFPTLDATIDLDAYVYDGPIVPPDIPAPVEEVPAGGTDALGRTD